MAFQFGLIAAQLYLGIITQKRPKKLTFQDLLDSNKGDETRPIPYVRGKWKTTPQRIWLGDFSARAVERDSHWSDYVFFGPVLSALLDTITVGYRYYVGQGFALTWGPINRVHQVYVQDLPCAVAPVVDNAGGSLLLDDPQLFGGDQPPGQGGIYGLCDVVAGTYTQGRNAYLVSLEGNVPALRGVAALIIRGRSGFTESGYFAANSIDLREWKVELMAWPDVLATGDAQLADQSFNRVHAMYEWATSADYGAKYPIERIHLPSWRTAAATCFTDGLGFSGEINTGGNVGEVFDQLRASVDAEVYEHPRDGLKLKLIRKDYSLPSVKVLDESNCNNVEEYTPGDNADTFNRVTLNFINAENNYQPRPAVYEDPANFHLQQRNSTREVEYPGVASAELAQKLVTRDGRVLSQPFPPLTLNGNDDAEELWPGDVYHFQWRDPLIRKIFRVHSRTPGVSYEGERNFRLTSTEDQYSIGLSVFGAPTGTSATNPADIWNTAPPSAAWDDVAIPSNGLRMDISSGLSDTLQSFITGAIEFGEYAGGQYARIYVTPPGGEQSLTPMRLSPNADGKAQFTWPALIPGEYEFCVQTFAIVTDATNGVKVCETTLAASFSPSPSASESPSASASLSPSSSVSPSVSPSLSPSSSVSPSASQSPSSSISASTSSSISPSSSVSPSASVSPSSSQSPSSSASASVSPSSSDSPSAPPPEITIDDDSFAENELTSLSWSHTVASGANRILLVFFYYWRNGGQTISGITYNSVALTKLDSQLNGDAQQRILEIWYLLNPDTGTHTIAATGTGSAASKQGGALSLLGVLQSAPTSFKTSGDSNNCSVNVTGATGDLFVDGWGKSGTNASTTPGTGQTKFIGFSQSSNQTLDCSYKDGTTSTTMSWTASNANDWAQIAVRVQPA